MNAGTLQLAAQLRGGEVEQAQGSSAAATTAKSPHSTPAAGLASTPDAD